MARTKKKPSRPKKGSATKRKSAVRQGGGISGLSEGLSRGGEILAEASVWALLLLVWWHHDSGAKDAFRLPKLVLAQTLTLASLFFLSWRLQRVPRWTLKSLLGPPALRAVLPLVAVAAASLAFSDFPLHGLDAWISLAIAAAALIGWSTGFSSAALDRLLGGILLPGVALSAVGILQFHNLYRPFDFIGDVEAQRLGITSYAGSAGDLSVMLVLPCLIAQHRLLTRRGLERALWGTGLVVCLYALAVTQTLTSVVALVLCSLFFWLWVLPLRKALAVGALVSVVAGLLVVGVAPLRERVAAKSRQLSRGSLNSVLTGRLDGWRAAVWMFEESPLLGVGHGAYRAKFAEAKLALSEEGTEFLKSQTQVMFVNAHNELLEVLAETGVLGIAALFWGLWVLVRTLRHRMPRRGSREPDDEAAPIVGAPIVGASTVGAPIVGASIVGGSAKSALAWSGLLALLLLSLGQFPFRLALTGYPAVLFLAWIFEARSRKEESP